MLNRIRIKSYKAFKSETEIEIRPITILIGRNSSGKSSICKLIDALAEAFSQDIAGFLPIETERNRLGDTYEDLFYQRISNDLHIGVGFDNGIRIDIAFLMQGGTFCPRSYSVMKDGVTIDRVFNSVKEAAAAGLLGLYWPSVCEEVGVSHSDVQFSVDYIGPIRSRGQRRLDRAGLRKKTNVGYDGRQVYDMLLQSHLTDGQLLKNVSDWCEANMDGQRLVLAEQAPGTGIYCLYVERKGVRVNLADVGEGLAQMLPVITQSFVRDSDITIIEQPSLHLNSAAHALVAERIVDSAQQLGKKYIIETHSDTFLTGIRKMVASRRIDRQDVVIYFLGNDGSEAILHKIEIDDNFEYTTWPDGMFEDDYRLQTEISELLG